MGGLDICYSLAEKAKFNKPYKEDVEKLANISLEKLEEELSDDNSKKTFWINIYNAFSVLLLLENGDKLNSRLFRMQHFNKSLIIIGGIKISLNNIEHQILRKDFSIFSPLTSKDKKNFIQRFSIEEKDYRIHFALNCGGMSCPPIRFYEVDKINDQLNIAEESFITTNTSFNEEKDEVETNELLKWYKFDFGGEKGLLELFKKYKIVPKQLSPKIKFSKYYWDNQFEFAEEI